MGAVLLSILPSAKCPCSAVVQCPVLSALATATHSCTMPLADFAHSVAASGMAYLLAWAETHYPQR